MELFRLFGVIDLDDKASKGLDGVDGKAEKTGSKFGKMGKAVAIGGAAVGAAAIGAGAALMKMAGNAGDHADRILDLNAITGMSTTSIQEWQNTAKVAGVSTEVMTNASSKLTKQMNILETGTGKGAEALQGLGVTYDELNAATPDEQMNMLTTALAGIEDPAERARLGTDLFGGAWQDLAPVVALGVDGMADARDQAHDLGAVMGEDALNNANEYRIGMENLKTMMSSFANNIGAAVAPMLTNVLLPAFEYLIPIIASFGETVVEWILKAIDVIGEMVAVVKGWVSSNEESVSAIKEGFIGFVDAIVSLFEGFFSLLTGLWEAWGPQIVVVAQAAWELIKNVFILAFDLIRDVFNVFGALFRGDWEGLWEAVKTLAVNLWNNIINVIVALVELLAKAVLLIWDFIASGLGVIMEAIFKGIKTVWGNIVDAISTYLSNVRQNISDQFSAVRDFISTIWNVIKDSLSTIVSNIVSAVKERFETMKSNINTIYNAIKTFILDLWESIKTRVSSIVDSIKNAVRDKFEEMKGAIRDKMKEAKTTITGIWDEIMSFLRGINLFSIGQDMIRGLINGIKGMAGSLLSTVKNLVNDNIPGPIKKILKIASPSKLMHQYGEWTGEGMEEGMEDSADGINNASRIMAKAAIPDFDAYPSTQASASLLQGARGGSSSSSVEGKTSSFVINPAAVNISGQRVGEITFDVTERLFGSASNKSAFLNGVRG